MMRSMKLLLGATALIAAATAAPASAATMCTNNDVSPTAIDCSGFFDGNLLNNSPADRQPQIDALAAIGYAYNGDFNSIVEKIDLNTQTVDFATLLTGISYIGIHFGNGNGGPGNGTAFYAIDAGTGLDQITLAYNASSSAVLYSTGASAVPEPATWAMMLIGFGAVGYSLRRRERKAVAFA